MALLAKWKWRLGIEKGGVWKDVLESRYGTWRDMKSCEKSKAIYLLERFM